MAEMRLFEKIKLLLKRIYGSPVFRVFADYVKENKWLGAVLLYVILLHLTICIAFYLGDLKHSIGNPFIQGLWGWLALFGICLLPGGMITRILLSLLVILQTAISIVNIFLSLVFSLPLRADAFAVLAVSSRQEVREFCSIFLSAKVVILLLASVLVIALLQLAIWKNSVRRKVWLYVFSGLLILPQIIEAVRLSSIDEFDCVYLRNPIFSLAHEFMTYQESVNRLSEMARHPQIPAGIRCRLSEDEKFTAVFVIGESATRSHHSIYGYPRKTNPLLEEVKDKLFLFTDVIAAYPHTIASLSYMLTNEDTQNLQDYRYTLFDVFKAAGFEIHFCSNQPRWGEFDSPISILTAHADKRLYLQERSAGAHDDGLLKYFSEALDGKGKKLIVLHLIGSHATYETRSPAEFKVFNRDNRVRSPYPEVDKWREVDEYDNSIRFTDFVLRKIIDRLEKDSGASFMLYCSDHGDFPEHRDREPRSPSATAPEFYEIPFVFYANPVFCEKYRSLLDDVGKNVDKPFLTDHIMYPILSASQISFDGFPGHFDLFSSAFVPPAERKKARNDAVYHFRANPYQDPGKK